MSCLEDCITSIISDKSSSSESNLFLFNRDVSSSQSSSFLLSERTAFRILTKYKKINFDKR